MSGFRIEGRQGDTFGSVSRGSPGDPAAVNLYLVRAEGPVSPAQFILEDPDGHRFPFFRFLDRTKETP